jgi:hypothetical protein
VLPDDELNDCVREYQANGTTGCTCYVADADGELAGYAVAAKEPSSCGPVERLYVRHGNHADADERAVAQALVSALCHDVERELPLPTVRDDGRTVLELYDRWGFVDVPALRRCLSMPSGHGRLMGIHTTP